MAGNKCISSIAEALEDIRNGRMVILMDDEDRENEGDLTIAAEKVTPEVINFMATHGRGLICLALTPEKVEALDLPMMTYRNRSQFGTGFTVSIDAKEGVTTGISAFDRARTILTAIRPDASPEDIVRPGHIFPLRAVKGGVLKRTGQTEGSVDLARLAGLNPAAVICEIMNEDGTMSRLPQLLKFARKFDLKIVTIADLIKYRLEKEVLVRRVERSKVVTGFGEFDLLTYVNGVNDLTHVCLTMGEITGDEPVLVRVHSQCLTGDTFQSKECDCGAQLSAAMAKISSEGKGVVIYLRQNAGEVGICRNKRDEILPQKGSASAAIDETLDTMPDFRDYGVGAQILLDLGIRKLRFLTDNPKKIIGFRGYGLEIDEWVPLQTASSRGDEGI
ncbi:3,4-dihydroxy-2-butanone-4-phosphate synthase [delta proteobacterium NaphS2]|nr:3,4-dihydroxy-2-butanone-4-phosphate synthase [delta proteobacterium NaphS2]